MVKKDKRDYTQEYCECDEHDPECDESHYGCVSRCGGNSAWPSRLARRVCGAARTISLVQSKHIEFYILVSSKMAWGSESGKLKSNSDVAHASPRSVHICADTAEAIHLKLMVVISGPFLLETTTFAIGSCIPAFGLIARHRSLLLVMLRSRLSEAKMNNQSYMADIPEEPYA
jgi:hypothetical protein